MTKIIIEVRGGMVQAVYSNNSDVQVAVFDLDSIDAQNMTAEEIQMQNEISHMKDVL